MAGQENNQGTKRSIRVFDCPGCGGQVEVRAFGHSLTCFCKHCGSEIDPTHSDFQLVKKYKEQTAEIILDIPLGSRGKLEGTTWEVIGYMMRKAAGYNFLWKEYLLFNPWKGYRWLTQTYGHWTFVEPMHSPPESRVTSGALQFDGKYFQLFNKGKATVLQVAGEFYWQVKRGDTVKTVDFIAPPFMLSKEETDSEITWSKGKYILPEEIKKSFGLTHRLPDRMAIGACQPNPYADFSKKGIRIFAITAALMFCISFMWTSVSPKRYFFTQTDSVWNGKNVVIPSVDVPGKTGNIMVEMEAPLDNDWIEAEGYLFSEESGKSYGFTIGFEHYSGVDGGEAWSEGSNSSWVMIHDVPAGKYEFVLAVAADNEPNNGVDARRYVSRISLYRNQPAWSNFVLGILLLGFPAGLATGLKYLFEKRRWEDEDE